MSCVKIHCNVWEVQLLDCIGGALLVSSCCARAFGNIHVGDQIGEGIRFYMLIRILFGRDI